MRAWPGIDPAQSAGLDPARVDEEGGDSLPVDGHGVAAAAQDRVPPLHHPPVLELVEPVKHLAQVAGCVDADVGALGQPVPLGVHDEVPLADMDLAALDLHLETEVAARDRVNLGVGGLRNDHQVRPPVPVDLRPRGREYTEVRVPRLLSDDDADKHVSGEPDVTLLERLDRP